MGNVPVGIVEDVVEDIANNMNDLAMCEDENEVKPDFHSEEVIEGVSVAESVNELDFES